jgi:hypothetical protein
VRRGAVPHTDARKSAVTDGLTKAASMLGIGHEVFKGLVRVGARLIPSNASSGRNGSTLIAFWALYQRQAKRAIVPTKAAAPAGMTEGRDLRGSASVHHLYQLLLV